VAFVGVLPLEKVENELQPERSGILLNVMVVAGNVKKGDGDEIRPNGGTCFSSLLTVP
jgi:hypothetical protein